ncbi:transposase [Streptococcus dysgalactiae subsp. equisimilis]|uniref:transposase n=1 Tax=Streptococcus dysgalactiae TaxID=1334 RepID=UPI000A0FA2F4|nr:transposase [Streptococcus dysgalactiae]MCY7195762.1 IS982 family transposase [Streptococcus dysgalactiae]MCY7200102.1 IS982 family transposase [Streptococcus dysgalactiae]MCY7207018.1 IS982 family transposase [Streptococcus dysgalactiae]MCY7215917.1 IS982 family transposase [Streptococcus dysgalactiae]MQA59425.1 IS982 family transposase [Streptococcus dysgalactiae]
MQSQNYYLENHTQTQVIFSKILTKVITLYRHFVPNDIRNRRNIHLQKQSDVILIASYLWALQEGCRTASAIYRAIRHNFFPDNFPERSRFCRICQNLAQSIQRMHYFMVSDICQNCSFGLIDSFPCALCQLIRNLRATLLSDVANIGYNATKKLHYYGLKFSVLVSDTGFPIDYVVTLAAVYDGDKGYVDQTTKEVLEHYVIHLISQLRKNMANYSSFENHNISRLRKPIETVFSSLEQFGIEGLRSRNL